MNSKNNTQTCLPPPSTDEASNSKVAKPATVPRLGVLLLEDNVELAELLRLIFETWEFQPTVAHLGREASRLLEEHSRRVRYRIGSPPRNVPRREWHSRC